MEHISPLIQTVLWVALVGAIVWRFHAPLDGLLTALQKRIESGSSIKAGPFELGDLRPQGVEEQVQKAQSEVSELLEAQADEVPDQRHPPAEVKSRFAVAEDLALRALQVEYGKPISRQVSLGPDLGVDGAFTVDGELNIVEVKHFIRSKRALPTVRSTLESFQRAFRRNHWRRVRVVLAVVLHHASEVEDTRRQLLALKSEFDFPIDVRCYSLKELTSKFAVE
jgi:hypothetical protein